MSVAVVRLFMAASILSRTSGCLRACSGSTSYGSLLNSTVVGSKSTCNSCYKAKAIKR